MKHIGKILVSIVLITCCLLGIAICAQADTAVIIPNINTHKNGWTLTGSGNVKPGIYFTAATNTAPAAIYTPVSESCIKVDFQGKIQEIGITGGLKLVKINNTEYCLTSNILSGPLGSQIAVMMTSGTVIVEGNFTGTGAGQGTTITMNKIYMELGSNGSTRFYTDNATSKEIKITHQPDNQYVTAGRNAQFSVSATGDSLQYQWQYRTAPDKQWQNASASGNTTAKLSVPATTSRHNFEYRCKITDSAGKEVFSDPASLHVFGIKTQPAGKTVKADTTVKLTVKATGKGLRYQWQYRKSTTSSWQSAKATGNTAATMSIPATISRHGYQYRCKITDSTGNTIYTKAVSLYVLGMKTQPANKTVKIGATAKFTVSAIGKGLTFQWQYRTSSTGSWKNASATGCKTKTISVPGTTSRNGYQYRCKITDSAGNVIYSNIVRLTVKK